MTNEFANKRIKQKTNLETDMKCIGTLRKIIVNLKDDSLHFICYGTEFKGEMKNLSKNRDPLIWLNFSEAIEIEKIIKVAVNMK